MPRKTNYNPRTVVWSEVPAEDLLAKVCELLWSGGRRLDQECRYHFTELVRRWAEERQLSAHSPVESQILGRVAAPEPDKAPAAGMSKEQAVVLRRVHPGLYAAAALPSARDITSRLSKQLPPEMVRDLQSFLEDSLQRFVAERISSPGAYAAPKPEAGSGTRAVVRGRPSQATNRPSPKSGRLS